MSSPKKYLIIGFAVCCVGLWLGGFLFFCKKINHYNLNKEHTDAIVVLTGGRNRIAEAILLFNDGLADKMFISGVSQKVTIGDIENKAGIELVFPDRAELGYKAENTLGNALEIKEWIERNNITSVRLVTSNYHLPRALAELAAYHLPLKVISHPVYSDHLSGKWWQSWGTFKFIFAEYNKFLFAYIRNLF